jgi:hypothetical protein
MINRLLKRNASGRLERQPIFKIVRKMNKNFWAKVDKKGENECWNYLGYLNKFGYGITSYKGESFKAHRLAYILKNGNIPNGLVIMHKCDNRRCCNPSHLLAGTQVDNIMDMIKKGRNAHPTHPSKLSPKTMESIRSNFKGKYGEKFYLSKKYNVSPTTITKILNNN